MILSLFTFMYISFFISINYYMKKKCIESIERKYEKDKKESTIERQIEREGEEKKGVRCVK